MIVDHGYAAQPGYVGYPEQDAYTMGRDDQCSRIICWVAIGLLILGLLIWFISLLTRPAYVAPAFVRHNLYASDPKMFFGS